MPATAGAIRAGRAFVELFTDDTALERGLKRAGAKLRSFGASVARIGAGVLGASTAVLGGLAAATTVFAKTGDDLQKMAQRTGVGGEALQKLAFAAQQSGTEIESLETGLRGMARLMLNASRGSADAVDTLGELGLAMSDLEGLTPEDQFKVFADRIAAISDPTKRAALAMRVFGRSGAELLPLLAGGAAGISALMDEAEALGVVMSDEDRAAAVRLTDALGRLKAQFVAILATVGASLAPALERIAGIITPLGRSVIDFVNANRSLFVTIAAVAVAAGVFGAGLVGLGTTIAFVGIVLQGLAAIVGVVTAALASPLGILALLVVAAAGAGAAFLAFTETGRRMVAQVAGHFGQLLSAVLPVFEAIKAALLNGDFAGAGRVAMAGLQVAWTAGVNKLLSIWDGFRLGVKIVLADLAVAAFDGFNKLFDGLLKITKALPEPLQRLLFGGPLGNLDVIRGTLGVAVNTAAEATRANAGAEFNAAEDARSRDLIAAHENLTAAIEAANTAALTDTWAKAASDAADGADAADGSRVNAAGSFSGETRQFLGTTDPVVENTERIAGLQRETVDLLRQVLSFG